MQSAALDRSRKLWAPRKRAVLWAKLLGIVHALLVLATILVGGGLAALVLTRGEAWWPANATSPPPRWLPESTANRLDGATLHPNSGVYPIVATHEASPHPIHRFGSRALRWFIRVVPPLRNNTGALTTLLAFALILLTLLSLETMARKAAVASAANESATALRRLIHRQMYRLGQSSLPSEGIGPVVGLFTREVNDVRDGLAAELDGGFRLPILAIALALLGLATNWITTLFLASVVALAWLAVRHLSKSSQLMSVVASRDVALQLSLLQEDFGLIRTVRVHGMENVDKQRFDEHLEAFRDADSRRMTHDLRPGPMPLLAIGAAVTIAVGVLAQAVLKGSLTAPAALVQIAALVGLTSILFEWEQRRRAIAQADRSAGGVFAYLERKPELHQAGGAKFLPPLRDKIAFENVTLEDGSRRPILNGLTVEIPARAKTSIMAMDDESKTALVCLIPRLIDPKVGRVRMDGHDLRDVTLESVRAQVAIVFQADLVFSDSVFANIGLGDDSYDLPRVIEAAKMAHAHHFIQELPDGYDTQIGPMGAYLKLDQQYRIALARAFLHDPSIVIIEEPSTPLDDDVKAFVDDTVARLAPGRTLIMLPHRLSTIRSSDHVIILQNGKLEAAGSPRDVGGESKLYRHIQYMEFNEFATGEMVAGQMGG